MRKAVVGLILLMLVGEAFCEYQHLITLKPKNINVRTVLQAFAYLTNVNIGTFEAASDTINLKETTCHQYVKITFGIEQIRFSQPVKQNKEKGLATSRPPFFLKISNRCACIFREFLSVVVKPFLI